jgi:release factor glutamine methyltransferase
MSEPGASIAQALVWATHQLHSVSATARLDSELLLAHVLGWGRARVLAERRHPIDAGQQAAFRDLVARRAALEPVAYLTGHKEFYGLDFAVDRRVLVPRPETELLVDLALAFARRKTEDEGRMSNAPSSSVLGPPSITIADIGTGSGCIAIALAVNMPAARIVATDISPDALAVARQNVERHAVAGQVRLAAGDLLEPLDAPVDMLVSNPPYTVLAEIDEGVRQHEPRPALDGGPDGLAVYRRLLAQAPVKLRASGAVLFEIGATQGHAAAGLARAAFPAARVSIHQDLAGLDRVVEIITAESAR